MVLLVFLDNQNQPLEVWLRAAQLEPKPWVVNKEEWDQVLETQPEHNKADKPRLQLDRLKADSDQLIKEELLEQPDSHKASLPLVLTKVDLVEILKELELPKDKLASAEILREQELPKDKLETLKALEFPKDRLVLEETLKEQELPKDKLASVEILRAQELLRDKLDKPEILKVLALPKDKLASVEMFRVQELPRDKLASQEEFKVELVLASKPHQPKNMKQLSQDSS